MRKIILSLATSFDGLIEGPNGEIDWLPFTEETGTMLNEFLKGIDTVLYGRVSYEAWGSYSPAETSSDFEKNFYETLRKMNKYVFSTTKEKFEGDPVVVRSNIKETVLSLKRQSGKNIWLYGGASLITTMMNLDLVDELQVAVAPIVLGSGKPLFSGIDHRVPLSLKNVSTDNSGMVVFAYEINTTANT
jgi:dihydrofolate reductase